MFIPRHRFLCFYVDTLSGDTYQDSGASATSGIQGNGEVGLTYSHDEPNLTSGTHVWFSVPE